MFSFFPKLPSLTHSVARALSPSLTHSVARSVESLTARRRSRLSLARAASAPPSHSSPPPLPLASSPTLHWPLRSADVAVPRSRFYFRRVDPKRGDSLCNGSSYGTARATPAACSCCSRMPPTRPSARSNDSPKLRVTACTEADTRRRSRPSGSTRRRGPPPAASAGQESATRPRPAASAYPSNLVACCLSATCQETGSAGSCNRPRNSEFVSLHT